MLTTACAREKHHQCRGRVLLLDEGRYEDCDCTCGHPVIPQTGKARKTPK